MIFYLETKPSQNQEKIIKEEISGISIFDEKNNQAIYLKLENESQIQDFKEIFENPEIKKIGINLNKIYILLKQVEINMEAIEYDIAIASYILNPTNNKLEITNLIEQYLNIDVRKLYRRRTKWRTNKFI